MRRPVICGVDDSATSDGAIDVARDLARRYELPLVFAHVVDRTDNGADSRVPRDVEVAVVSGHPADRLVELAHERRAAFLVVGNHGARSSLLGSVSADVARRAPCPVIVVPPTAVTSFATAAGLEGGILRFDLERVAR